MTDFEAIEKAINKWKDNKDFKRSFNCPICGYKIVPFKDKTIKESTCSVCFFYGTETTSKWKALKSKYR